MQVSTHTYLVSENVSFSTKAYLILLMSAFFGKNICFLKVPLLKALVWELFCSIFSFCKVKGYFWWNHFTDNVSGIWLPDSSKLTINWKKDNNVTICWHDVTFKVYWRCFFSYKNQLLVQVSCQYHHWFWSYVKCFL